MATSARDLVTNLIVRDQASRELARASQAANRTRRSFGDLSRELSGFVTIYSTINLVKTSILSFAEVQDAISALQVTFGTTGEKFIQFARQSGDALNVSQKEALSAALVFGNYGRAAGLAGEQLENFVIPMLTRAADAASYFGGTTENALNAFMAAMRGENEPVRKYGVLLNDATLRIEAFNLGITKTTDKALTPQQRVLAAYNAVMKQTMQAQGDVSRTSEQMGNKIKDANQKFEDFKSELGKVLSIVAGPALDAFGLLLSSAQPLLSAFDKLPSTTKTAIASVALVGGAFLALRGPIMSAVTAVRTLRAAMTAASFANPVVAAIGLIIGAFGALFIAQQNARQAADDFAATYDNLGKKTNATKKLIAESLTFNITGADEWKILEQLGFSLKDVTAAIYEGGPALQDLQSRLDAAADAYGENVNLVALFGNAVEAARRDLSAGAEAAKTNALATAAAGDAAATAAPKFQATSAAVRASATYMTALAGATGEYRRELARMLDKPTTDAATRTSIQNQADTDAAAARARRAQAAADAEAEAKQRREAAAEAARQARQAAIETASSFASGIASSIASYGRLALLTDKLTEARGRLADANDRLKTSTADAAEARRTLAQLAGDTSPAAAAARAEAERKLAEAQAAGAKAARDKAKAAKDEEAAKPTAKNILADVRRRLGNIRAFANVLTRLKRLGLNNTMLQDLINAGPEEGLLLARAMESAGFVKEANALQSQINVQSGRIGAVGAASQFSGPGEQVQIQIVLDGKTVQTALVSLKRAQGGKLNF